MIDPASVCQALQTGRRPSRQSTPGLISFRSTCKLIDELSTWKLNVDVIRIPQQLGPVLRAARLQQQFTQSDIAKGLGITVQAVSKLENNAGRASFERIHKLCALLGLELVLRPKGSGTVSAPPTSTAEW